MKNFLARLEEASPAHLTQEELTLLLGHAETVREENTGVSGMLRILKLGDVHLIQEQTPDRQSLLRSRPDSRGSGGFRGKAPANL